MGRLKFHLKLSVFFYLVFSTALQAQIKWGQNNDEFGHTLEWRTPRPKITSWSVPQGFDDLGVSHKWVEFKLKGLAQTKKAKAPALPYDSFLLVGEKEDIEMKIDEKIIAYKTGVLPAPAPQWPCRCEDEQISWELDSKAYQKSASQDWIELEDVGDYKGEPLTKVTFRPARYTGEGIEVLESANIEFNKARRFYPDQIYSENSSERFLLIAPARYQRHLQRFVEAKEQQGLEVVWHEYQNQSFELLKSEIKNIYREREFDYALIVGTEDEVPTEYVWTSADPETPSDMNYFTLGEQRDLIPDVFYSRLPAQNQEQLEALIEKLLRAENDQQLFAQSDFMALASDEGMNPTDVEYSEQMADPLEKYLGWKPHFYVQRRPQSKVEDILDGFKNGAYWLNYIGHGVGPAWTSITGGEFNVDDIQNIIPHETLPVVIDVACQNGRVTPDSRLGVHLMNHQVRGVPAGARAYYGGSVDISWHPPAVMAVGIAKARSQMSGSSLGEILWAGQMHLLETYDDLPAAAENLVWYQLQGDPSALMSP